MFDPPQVAFSKNWQRDFNRSTMTLSGRVSDKDIRDSGTEAQAEPLEDFPRALHATKDTRSLRRPARTCFGLALPSSIWRSMLLSATFPGGARTYAVDAGEATFAIEVRDSLTGPVARPGRRSARSGRRTDLSSRLRQQSRRFRSLVRRLGKDCCTRADRTQVSLASRYGRDPQAIACRTRPRPRHRSRSLHSPPRAAPVTGASNRRPAHLGTIPDVAKGYP